MPRLTTGLVTLCRKEEIVLTELDRRRSSSIRPLADACDLSVEDAILALCMLKGSHLVDYDLVGDVKHWRLTLRGRAWIFGGQQLAAVTDVGVANG